MQYRKNQFFPAFWAYLCVCVMCLGGVAWTQQPELADYRRAIDFSWRNLKSEMHGLSIQPNWMEGDEAFWYEITTPEGKSWQLVWTDEGKPMPLFDHEVLAQDLSDISGKTYTAGELPISDVDYLDGDTLVFNFDSKEYIWVLAQEHGEKGKAVGKPTKREEPESHPDQRKQSESPDKKWVAFVEDHNLMLEANGSNAPVALTTNGAKNYEHASYYGWFDKMEGEGGDRPERFSVTWSPDSKYLKASLVDLRSAEKMYLLDYSIDTLFRPKLLSYYRGSPGDTTMVHVTPLLFDVEANKQLSIELPRGTHINPTQVRFSEQSGRAFARVDHRGYQKIEILEIDLKGEKVKTVLTETSETNLDNFSYEIHEKKNRLVFLSERNGWRQLYAYDLKKGKTEALTQGQYYIHELLHHDVKKDLLYFVASGEKAGENPYFHSLYVYSFKDKSVRCLTPEPGNHKVYLSETGAYFVDNHSTPTELTRTSLHSTRTESGGTMFSKANADFLFDQGWQLPEMFQTLAPDGKTMLYGAIWKPIDFDPTRKYPVIDHSYTGPHTQRSPRSFIQSVANSHISTAELGFVVVAVDGRGTASRSKAFRDVSYKNMGANLDDHLLILKAMGAKYPWMDLDRVGVYGHSAGGYDAGHALLAYPEFYKVGVASSADHDFRMEKAWWPEMYMGWPVDFTYNQVSNISLAENLQGKLLITHGSLDDNVNPSATFKLAENLIRANKEFDLVVLPSQRHGYADSTHYWFFQKKRWNFFVEHLLGAEPLWQIEPTGMESPSERLARLLTEYSEPFSGEGGWPELRAEALAERQEKLDRIVKELKEIDAGQLSAEEEITLDLLRLVVEDEAFNLRFGARLFPLDAEGGFITGVLYMLNGYQINSEDDLTQYIHKLKTLPAYFEHRKKDMRSGQQQGKSACQLVVDRCIAMIDQTVTIPPEESFFMNGVAQAENAAWRKSVLKVVQSEVYPAYADMRKFLKEEYRPKAPAAIGISEITDGKAFYTQRTNYYTTLQTSPDAVFEKGQTEVTRIKAEMQAIIDELGYKGSFADFLQFLREDKQFYAQSEEELLSHATGIVNRVRGQLPKYFGKHPRLPMVVKPVPASLAPTYTSGRYSEGSYADNKAGEYWVNTYNLPSRPLYVLPALSLHEGLPGHHTQIMLAEEMEGVADLRRTTYLSAYGEGWALYAEYLGKEMGIYQTPYEEFGRLVYEMWRACRLVVDPGIHHKGWTREQAVTFMTENTALSLHEINSEVDRYIGWPGQAVSYKTGELKIRELRARAETKLGTDFDLPAFHDLVLKNGSVPLNTLERIVDDYIEEKLEMKR